MRNKHFLATLALFGLIALSFLILPARSQAQEPSGDENFIFVNYIGQELILDLDDVTYVVPGTAIAPEGGRLALQLAPGEHKYAANVPGVPTGSAGEFTLTGDQVVAKAARIEQTSPVVQNEILIEKPEDYVLVFDFDPFATPQADTPLTDTWQPAPASAGQGSLVWINHGGPDQLTVDLAGQLYQVPPKANDIPGRLQIEVAPGFYRYTASLPNGSLNGEVTVSAGQVIGLNIIPGQRETPEYDVGDTYDPLTQIELSLYQEDLTAQAVTAPKPATAPMDSATVTPTATVTATTAAAETAPSPTDGLLVKNYAGETLLLTINNEVYPIENNSERTLTLPPGSYNYTASLPFVATTGTVEMVPGQPVELSVAINLQGDVLSVYQN